MPRMVAAAHPELGATSVHPSGLLVPDAVARERYVVTKTEWKTIDRAVRILHAMSLDLELECKKPECRNVPLERIRRPDGTPMLRCPHMDRVILPVER